MFPAGARNRPDHMKRVNMSLGEGMSVTKLFKMNRNLALWHLEINLESHPWSCLFERLWPSRPIQTMIEPTNPVLSIPRKRKVHNPIGSVMLSNSPSRELKMSEKGARTLRTIECGRGTSISRSSFLYATWVT